MTTPRFSAFIVALCSCIHLFASLPQVTVRYDSTFTGRGNESELIFEALLIPEGKTYVKSLILDSGDTSSSDIDALHIMLVHPDGTEMCLATYGLMTGRYEYSLPSPLLLGAETRIQVRTDVSRNAEEGNRIALQLKEIVCSRSAMSCGKPRKVQLSDSCPGREILLCRKRLYAPGDYGSRNWRIPALLALPDGSLLAVNDKRKYIESDLPEDIDIVARRSTDKGHTWSEPVEIAVGTGYKKGFGDPALALAPDGDVVCVFVGGNGLWASTPDDPQLSYLSRSSDGGQTWSEPENITSLLWGENALNPQCRKYSYSFFGSGNGLTLRHGEHAGRILFAAAMGAGGILNNHAVYSDDGGHTWNVSDLAFESGDEAKMVELSDGRILMSIRRSGYRGYSISDDGGVTWHGQGLWPEIDTNACNGDMIRYSMADGDGRENLLLHSVPNSHERRNVSIFCSYDEGKSWCSPKTLCPYKSVYSSMTVLDDGTIGIYLEENPEPEDCSLWYMNFSIGWLTSGKVEQ